MLRRKDQFLCGVVEGFYGRPWLTSQRVDLFTRMSEWGMNTYLYAPKDDDKHRACWRELYSLDEANQLSHLIHQATSRGIFFIYAIAPGLDITFSSTKEMELLKRKLDQVSALGCNSFAILFDDIDPDMCPADDKIFPSYAHAQVAITNDMYAHLDKPNVFLFCPTEYCASRAVPSVSMSQYLQHIGTELHQAIDIMWTGPKVISKVISLSSIQELSCILRRPPILWDNLHANDYDQRRLFLGPYSGRSITLHSHLNGVLTNPNCEFTANYIAIHTLSQWSRSAHKLTRRPSPTQQAFQLEVDGQTNEFNPSDTNQALSSESVDIGESSVTKKSDKACLDVHLYEPGKALEIATKEWMSEFQKSLTQPDHYVPVKNPLSIAKANEYEELGPIGQEDIANLDVPDSKQVDAEIDPKLSELSGAILSDPFGYEDLKLLIDFFYLPHQHGESALKILEEFCWIKENAPGYESLHSMGKLKGRRGESDEVESVKENDVICDRVSEDGMKSDGETSDRTEEERPSTQEVTEWCDRCQSFHLLCQMVKDMYSRLTAISNRPLLYDVYQYMWDAKETTMLLDSYVSWLESGGSEINTAHEPYLPRGGITSEMQALLPRMKRSQSLYRGGHTPKTPSPETYTIRPYRPEDKEQVYLVCLETGDNGRDATYLFTNYPDLLGDRFVGPYLSLSPDLSFVLEDHLGVCGYVLATLDSKIFYDGYHSNWLMQLEGKYPPHSSSCHGDGSEIELLREVQRPNFYLPPPLYLEHPSHLHIDLLPRAQGKGMGTSLIKTILAILKAKGSTGVHLEMNAANKRALKFYLKRGFTVSEFDPPPPDDVIILGREL